MQNMLSQFPVLNLFKPLREPNEKSNHPLSTLLSFSAGSVDGQGLLRGAVKGLRRRSNLALLEARKPTPAIPAKYFNDIEPGLHKTSYESVSGRSAPTEANLIGNAEREISVRVEKNVAEKMTSYFSQQPQLFPKMQVEGVGALDRYILPKVEESMLQQQAKLSQSFRKTPAIVNDTLNSATTARVMEGEAIANDLKLLDKYKIKTAAYFEGQTYYRVFTPLAALSIGLTGYQVYHSIADDYKKYRSWGRESVRTMGEIMGSQILGKFGSRFGILSAMGLGYAGAIYGGRAMEALYNRRYGENA